MANFGDGRRDNYVSDSDSDQQEVDEIPPTVDVPMSDGLPQVRGVKALKWRTHLSAAE